MDNEKMLNRLLADLAVLYQKQRNYHWNVTGHNFMGIHAFLEKEYDAFAEFIDEVAELARKKGMNPISTYKEFLEATELKEGDSKKSRDEMLKEIISDYKKVLQYLEGQEELDKTTEDLFIVMMNHIEKSLWMLKSEVM